MTALHPRRPDHPPQTSEIVLPTPVRVADLSPEEQLVIRGFRRWVSGEAYWAHAWNDVAVHFGGTQGKPVMSALVRLVESLRAVAERRILHHAPCCPCLSADEVRLVGLLGAAARGGVESARVHAAVLICAGGPLGLGRCAADGAGCLAVAEAAHILARALARADVA